MKMARCQIFWIQMRKIKPLDESRKTGQTSWTKIAFYSCQDLQNFGNPYGLYQDPPCTTVPQPSNIGQNENTPHMNKQLQRVYQLFSLISRFVQLYT
ncbi:hypothetical protein Hanom_Chr11g01056431 [Helianthus anomalus]